MLHYYIYYRVNPSFETEASAAVKQIQFDIETEANIAGRLLSKREEPQLWMEVYEGVAAAEVFETILNKAVEKSGLERLLQPGSTRKTECFQG